MACYTTRRAGLSIPGFRAIFCTVKTPCATIPAHRTPPSFIQGGQTVIASLLLTALVLIQTTAGRPEYAQGGGQGRPTQPAPTETQAQRPATPDRPMIEEAPVVTKH